MRSGGTRVSLTLPWLTLESSALSLKNEAKQASGMSCLVAFY